MGKGSWSKSNSERTLRHCYRQGSLQGAYQGGVDGKLQTVLTRPSMPMLVSRGSMSSSNVSAQV